MKPTALVCIAKNEDHYIQEWCEYHLKLGFDHIFIYQDDWRCQPPHSGVPAPVPSARDCLYPPANKDNHADCQ